MSPCFLLSIILALVMHAGSTRAAEPESPPALLLAAEAKALCEQQSAQPVADCMRETLGDAGIESVQKALSELYREASDAFYNGVAEQLLKREDPLATLLAARLLRAQVEYRPTGPRQDDAAQALRARVGELARAAAMRAEDDPMLLWSLAGDAFSRAAPDVSMAAIARLQALQPDNLAVFVLGDGAQPWSTAQLQQAAAARRFDLPFFALLRSDLDLLSEFAVPGPLLNVRGLGRVESIEAHQIMVLGMQMAEAIPSLRGLAQACNPGHAGWLPEHRLPCERIAAVLAQNSSTAIGWTTGISLLERLADTPEKRTAADAARRTYRYQILEGMSVPGTTEGKKAWLRAMRQPGAEEVGLIRQHLAARDLPEQPPADWQPMTYAERQARRTSERESE